MSMPRHGVKAPRARKHSQWLAWMAQVAAARAQARYEPLPAATLSTSLDFVGRATSFLDAVQSFRLQTLTADALRNRAPVRARRA